MDSSLTGLKPLSAVPCGDVTLMVSLHRRPLFCMKLDVWSSVTYELHRLLSRPAVPLYTEQWQLAPHASRAQHRLQAPLGTGHMFCCCFLFIYLFLSNSCPTNYLILYWTNVWQIFRVDRSTAVDVHLKLVLWPLKGRCHVVIFTGLIFVMSELNKKINY